MNMEFIDGGICAPHGFSAAAVHCGFRADVAKNDLALIVSDEMCSAAAVYTTNKVKGAPVAVNKKHLADGQAKAVICNSGNANTCAPGGKEVAEKTCELVAKQLGCSSNDVVVASTGVIGMEFTIDPFVAGVPAAAEILDYNGCEEAEEAIMTTDTVKKIVAVKFELGGKPCVIGGMAKGSGMIHPNMATMLAFITSDVAISPEMLQKALSADVVDSFNQLSVDGDTSTNDMCLVMANGLAGNTAINSDGKDFDTFCEALNAVTSYIVEHMAADGEGASKLIVCEVINAETKDEARKISRTVVSSNLTKAAIFGRDANWGRVVAAVGYTEGDFDISNIDVTLSSECGSIEVCKGTKMADYSEEEATDILTEDAINILVNMNTGDQSAKAWGCDLTYDYVTINSDYRS